MKQKFRYFIDIGCFVVPCEFDTQEQFYRFREYCKKECEDANTRIEKELARQNLPVDAMPRYSFEYRDNFFMTESDKKWEEIIENDGEPFSIILATIYPESVLDNAPPAFIDRQANWKNRNKRKYHDARREEAAKKDIDSIERYLERAKQIRKNLTGRLRAPRTTEIDLERAVDYVVES